MAPHPCVDETQKFRRILEMIIGYRMKPSIIILIVGLYAVVLSCASRPPAIDVPDDDNKYLLSRLDHDVHLRPTLSAPVIGEIRSYENEPIKVLGYTHVPDDRIDEGRYWWQTEYNGQIGYIRTVAYDDFLHLPRGFPPEFDPLAGYQGETPLITGVRPSEPDSADGVDIQIGVINLREGETIRYLRFVVQPYNAVGDQVEGEIHGRDKAKLELTGPIEPDGAELWIHFGNIFYNATIACVELVNLEIEYMDESVEEYDKTELSDFFHVDTDNTCRVQ